MITTEETTSMTPICPHCKAELNKIWFRQLQSYFGKRYIYFCTTCRATLGISQRKGFWMG